MTSRKLPFFTPPALLLALLLQPAAALASTTYSFVVGKAAYQLSCADRSRGTGSRGSCRLSSLDEHGKWNEVAEGDFRSAPRPGSKGQIGGLSLERFIWETELQLIPNEGPGAILTMGDTAFLCTAENRVIRFDRSQIDPLTSRIRIQKAPDGASYRISTFHEDKPARRSLISRLGITKAGNRPAPPLALSTFELQMDGSIPPQEIQALAGEREISPIRDHVAPYEFHAQGPAYGDPGTTYRISLANPTREIPSIDPKDGLIERKKPDGTWEAVASDRFDEVSLDLRSGQKLQTRYPSSRALPEARSVDPGSGGLFLGARHAYLLTSEGRALIFDRSLLENGPGILNRAERLPGEAGYRITSMLYQDRSWDPFKLAEVTLSPHGRIESAFKHVGEIPAPGPNGLKDLMDGFARIWEQQRAGKRASISLNLTPAVTLSPAMAAVGSDSRSTGAGAGSPAHAPPTDHSTSTWTAQDLRFRLRDPANYVIWRAIGDYPGALVSPDGYLVVQAGSDAHSAFESFQARHPEGSPRLTEAQSASVRPLLVERIRNWEKLQRLKLDYLRFSTEKPQPGWAANSRVMTISVIHDTNRTIERADKELAKVFGAPKPISGPDGNPLAGCRVTETEAMNNLGK